MVPGLDLALLSMKAGEKALIVVQPEGGYGAAGNIDFPRVPGSATLFYEVEMLKLEKEPELWEMEFEEKVHKATLRRERGNTLFRGRHFKEADDEYEQAPKPACFGCALSNSTAHGSWTRGSVRAVETAQRMPAPDSMPTALPLDTAGHALPVLHAAPDGGGGGRAQARRGPHEPQPDRFQGVRSASRPLHGDVTKEA
eukprot:6188082-Pleurochrysis_carterae.AAC.1